MSATACRVSSDLAQYQHELSDRDDHAEALFDECQRVVNSEPVEDIMEELFGDKAIDRMGEWETNLFKTDAKDLPAALDARKIYLRDQLIAARGES